MLWSGSGRGGRELWVASSDAEIRPRGRPALERGGDSPEVGPRARQRFCSVAPDPRGRWRFSRGAPRLAASMGWLRLLGLWFSASGHDYAGCDLRFAGSFRFCYFARNGFFPSHQGTLMVVSDSSP
jgi:hypothetical protein